MDDAFDEMRREALRMHATSNGSTPTPEQNRIDWKLEVMDRIEAIERFLDRDMED